MSFIEDFYNGNIEPQKRNSKQNTVYTKDLSRLNEIEDTLKEKLGEDEKSLFIEYMNLWGIISGDIDLCSYKMGFRHGSRFSIDVFNTDND